MMRPADHDPGRTAPALVLALGLALLAGCDASPGLAPSFESAQFVSPGSGVRLRVLSVSIDPAPRRILCTPRGVLLGSAGAVFLKPAAGGAPRVVWPPVLDAPDDGQTSTGEIVGMALDSRDQLWLAQENGAVRIPPQAWAAAGSAPTHTVVTCPGLVALAADGTGAIWGGTRRGVVRLNPLSRSPLPLKGSPGSYATLALCADGAGTLHALVRSGERVLLATLTGDSLQPLALPAAVSCRLTTNGEPLPFAVDGAGGRAIGRWTVSPAGTLGEIPSRDRTSFGHGLRSARVAGVRAIRPWRTSGPGRSQSTIVAYWFGAGEGGVSLRIEDRGRTRFVDLLASSQVFDLDVDGAGDLWAATDGGLVRLPADRLGRCVIDPVSPLGDGVAVDLPRFAPGNALDGLFQQDGALHVFGTAGLFRLESAPRSSRTSSIASPPPQGGWKEIIAGPVRDAKPAGKGFAALVGPRIWLYPGPQALGTVFPPAVSHFAFTTPGRLVLASPSGLFSARPSQKVPILETILPTSPVALVAREGAFLAAGAGRPGGLWVGKELKESVGPAFSVAHLDVPARCFLVDGGRVLVGTADGLVCLEDTRTCPFIPHRRGLEMSAMARQASYYLFATSDGLLVHDGPALLARHPLGAGGGPGRITGFSCDRDGFWAATAGLGLWRFAIADGTSPRAGDGGSVGR